MVVNHISIAFAGEPKASVRNLTDRKPREQVILTYDSLLTLSYEVEYIWHKTFKLGTALYFLTRYVMLLYLWIEAIGQSIVIPSLQVCSFWRLSLRFH
jgi:Family of unknown function (DUF6533)